MNRKILSHLVRVGAVAALLLTAPGHVGAAPPDHSHESFSDSFPDEFCGIEGTSVISGIQNLVRFADRTFIRTESSTQTFTATDSQKSFSIKFAAVLTRRSLPIDNGDGTLTFVVTFKGLYGQLRIGDGPALLIDAGTLTFANTFAVNADGTSTYLSSTIVEVRGPHPDALSDGAILCDVVVPALT